METGVNEKTSNYLEARISNLSSYERNVVLIVDEIYTAQRVEYSPGKLHGIDDGQVTKNIAMFHGFFSGWALPGRRLSRAGSELDIKDSSQVLWFSVTNCN